MTLGSLALLTREDLLLLVIVSNRSPLTTIAALPLSTDRILGELEMTMFVAIPHWLAKYRLYAMVSVSLFTPGSGSAFSLFSSVNIYINFFF